MAVQVDVDNASQSSPVPGDEDVHRWVEQSILQSFTHPINSRMDFPAVNNSDDQPAYEVCLRFVDEAEITRLNQQYRGQNTPTNVLSFPADLPEEIPLRLLGDIVICVPVVNREAIEQHKPWQAHWAHMLVHGTLHLLGFDHIEEADAIVMEALETEILARQGFPDPYLEIHT